MANESQRLGAGKGIVLAGVSAFALMNAKPALAQEQQQGGGLETIVVTAQKRTENLQVVPVAVTAITSKTIQDMRIDRLTSLNAIAPGVTVRESAGGNVTPVMTIRGVYGSSTFASDPGVAFYIDGVFLSSTNGANLDLAEIDRIEVLRGPQGTLFGRNAIGGAVNVITKEPTGTFGAHQEFSIGNEDQFRTRTSIDLPKWGLVSAYVAFLHDEQNGDVRNLGAGTAWNWGPATDGRYGLRTSPATLGGHDTNAVAAALKFETESGIKAVYRFDYSHKVYTPDAVGILTFNTGPGANAFLSGLFGSFWQAQSSATRTPLSAIRPAAVNNWYTTPSLDTDQIQNLTITVPIADGVTFKNLLAARRMHTDTTNQLDGLGGLFAAPGLPLLPIENDTQSDQTSMQEEAQINIDMKWVKSTIGYMHYYSHDVEGGLNNALDTPFGSGLFPTGGPGYPNFVAQASPGILLDDVSLKSDAVYAQNEIHVLPKLDVVLGGRYTWDRRGGFDNSPTPNAPGVPVTYNKNTPTYLLGLNYKVTDNIFTYAKLSTAYITGGRIAGLAFNPESAKSYEAGIKSDLLDNRLRVNLAGYTVKYTAVQVLTNPAVGCAGFPGVSPAASQCIVNGGDEKANGFEAEVTLVPIDSLTLGGNLSYTDVSLSKVPPNLAGPDGNFVSVFTPAWTGSVSVQYTGADIEAVGGSHVTARIEGDYMSSAFGSTPNSVVAVANAAKIPARMIVDARLGLAGFKMGGADAEIAAYVKNLTDNKSITYDFNAGMVIPVNYESARTFGLDLNVGF